MQEVGRLILVSPPPVSFARLLTIVFFNSQLESLIESKIYREDELEREIETLKYELARASSASRAGSSASRRRDSDEPIPALGSFAAKTARLQGVSPLHDRCDDRR